MRKPRTKQDLLDHPYVANVKPVKVFTATVEGNTTHLKFINLKECDHYIKSNLTWLNSHKTWVRVDSVNLTIVK